MKWNIGLANLSRLIDILPSDLFEGKYVGKRVVYKLT